MPDSGTLSQRVRASTSQGTSPLSVSGAFVHFFARRNCHSKSVSGRREWTRRVRIVGAGRVVGLVEIEDDGAIVRSIRIEEPGCGIRFLGAGQIPEYKRQCSRFVFFVVQTILLAMKSKDRTADDGN